MHTTTFPHRLRFRVKDGLMALLFCGLVFTRPAAAQSNSAAYSFTTIAGFAGSYGSADGAGNDARFASPSGVTVDMNGNLYVSDAKNSTIRKVTPAGVVSTIAGFPGSIGSTDGTNSAARFFAPHGLVTDGMGHLYVADAGNNAIRKLTPDGTNWVVSTLAGLPGNNGSTDGTNSTARFNTPFGVAVNSAGQVFVADTFNNTIRKLTPVGTNWVVSTVAGMAGPLPSGADGTNNVARFFNPFGLAVDTNDHVYVADAGNNTVRKMIPSGTNWVVSTIAGMVAIFGSTDGTNNAARFNTPAHVAVDGTGRLFVADYANSTIRQITPTGTNWVVSTLAGLAPLPGSADGTGTNALFNHPYGVAVDSAGNVFVADSDNNAIRKITSARFNQPRGVAVDSAGNIFVADGNNHTIRKLTAEGTNWVASTVAGLAGNTGSADGLGGVARFSRPFGIVVDAAQNIFVTDNQNFTIRRITPAGTNWLVSTIGGQPGFRGSADGAGRAAQFNNPFGIAVDGAGNVYVADGANNTIRKGIFTQYGVGHPVPYIRPPMDGQLTVTLLPPEANGQWRFPWELGWRASGTTAGNLVAGNYPVEFRTPPGYLIIATNFVVAVTNGGTTYVTNQYYPTLSIVDPNTTGTLTVNIGPAAPAGSGWRFLGDSTPYFPPGYTTNLAPDTYLIEFAPVSGRSKPASEAVQVFAGLPTILSVNYLLAAVPPPGFNLPVPVSSASITNLANFPFGFNGQIQSDTRFGSGVAVQTNVVLTVAHLVFNDQTLSYVSELYWYLQKQAGVFEPKPQSARGWYVLSGYAAQRTNDLQSGLYAPDQSTPQSRNMDVAALYFLSPVAGGGYGGYLPSDAVPNAWLTGTSDKLLVGYPVDGSLFGDASIVPGTMYQTGPQPYPLSQAADPVANQQVYTASWFLSYRGNSGGPLYVQFNGYYYPAAVYVGTLFNGTEPYASVVRAIDSNVVNLITLAASQGDSGTNNTSGGVITIIPSQGISAGNPGYVQFQLTPPAAVRAGAAWRLQGDSAYSSATNYTRAVLSTNAFAVEFKPINGWNLPSNQSVFVVPGVLITNTAFYSVTNPLLVNNRAIGIGITGTTGTVYRLERKSSLTNTTWSPLSTNTINSNGFNLVLPKPATNPPTTFYRLQWLP